MKLKETNKFQTLTSGANVKMSTKHGSYVATYQGVVESVNGLNGDLYKVLFTNGRYAYLTWKTTVELV